MPSLPCAADTYTHIYIHTPRIGYNGPNIAALIVSSRALVYTISCPMYAIDCLLRPCSVPSLEAGLPSLSCVLLLLLMLLLLFFLSLSLVLIVSSSTLEVLFLPSCHPMSSLYLSDTAVVEQPDARWATSTTVQVLGSAELVT